MTFSSSHILQENPDRVASRLLQEAHNRDGLPEIAVGLFFLAEAGLTGLHAAFHGRSPYGMAALGLLTVNPLLFFASGWAIKKVRERLPIEKVGYVKLKPLNKKMMVRVISIAIVTAVIAAFATYFLVRTTGAQLQPSAAPQHSIDWPLLARWSFAATGIFGGVLCVMCGRSSRFIIFGAIMAATGIALAFAGISVELGMTILYGVTGSLSFVSGCIVLMLFLRQPVEEGETK